MMSIILVFHRHYDLTKYIKHKDVTILRFVPMNMKYNECN